MIGLGVYWPALGGEFISDDQHYLWGNPYVTEASWDHVGEILDPQGALIPLVENYAPVHLLLHSLQWQVFGRDVRGHHVVNVLLHALASVLLVALLLRTGAGREAAVVGGAIFLVHPANVEAVAWISQLKSSSALVLCLGALLAHPRRPLLGTVCFGLALLAKPAALVALPTAIVLGWVRSGERGEPSGEESPAAGWRWGWLAAWVGVLAGFMLLELAAFAETAGTNPSVYTDPWVRLRSSVANAGRYLWMTLTGSGLSTFHEPPAITSWLDPRWWVPLALLGLAGWRSVVVLRDRRMEAVWWAWAAAGYAPASGVLALPFAMADRYLYFVLPGLIGVAVFALPEIAERLGRFATARGADPESVARGLARAGWVAPLLLGVIFGLQAHARADIWKASHRVMLDSALRYPEGRAALMQKAARAAQAGDVETVVAALQAAHRRSYNTLGQLLEDPVYAPYRDDPIFRAHLERVAGDWLQLLERDDDPSQIQLYVMSVAYTVRGEEAAALAALERAVEIGGPIDDRVRDELDQLRRKRRLSKQRS